MFEMWLGTNIVICDRIHKTLCGLVLTSHFSRNLYSKFYFMVAKQK